MSSLSDVTVFSVSNSRAGLGLDGGWGLGDWIGLDGWLELGD